MSTTAVVMMIIALLAVWGGLGLALLNLRRHPEAIEDEPNPGPRADASVPVPHDRSSGAGTSSEVGPGTTSGSG